ncbi:MAG: VWA domain-containing protein, partial [Spirochaetaceae bacterium]|nr:VWA domain-containing protein [Spirochaetaceae bacterium]
MTVLRACRFVAALVLVAIVAACAGAPAPAQAGSADGAPGGDGRAEAPIAETGKRPSMPAAPSPAMAMDSASADKLGSSTFSPSGAGASDAAPPPPAMAPPSTPAPSVGRTATGQSGLKAGYSDDNEQFNYFAKFLGEYARVRHYELAVQERIVVRVRDSAGMAVMNAQVEARSDGKVVARGKTYADGSFSLYPLELEAPEALAYELAISSAVGQASLAVERAGPRSVTATLGGKRSVPAPLPVDLVFILDTTGSMGEEIERLRATIEIISANIASLKPKPALRFGMVLYKDRGDDYDTRIVPLTPSLPAFQEVLDEVYADGGGDGPEDLQAALGDAVNGFEWNTEGLRMGFVITDAPPHLDYGQEYDYARAARDAKEGAIKLYGI